MYRYSQVVHYYPGGDVCDITKQPRECQVKIKYAISLQFLRIKIIVYYFL